MQQYAQINTQVRSFQGVGRTGGRADQLAATVLRERQNGGGQRPRAARLWSSLVALVFGVLVAGCSMVKVGYENLPLLVVWEIGGTLDLDAAQRRIVERHVAEIREWHRRTQLPQYVRLIADAETGLGDTINTARITGWREHLLASWQPLAERLAPAVAELGVTLSPAQVTRLEDEFAERNRETVREYKVDAPQPVREKARRERFEKRAESLLGYLSEEQRRIIGESSANASDEAAWWSLRRARQRMFVDLLMRLARERPEPQRARSMAQETLQGLYWAVGGETREAIERRAAAADALAARLMQRSSLAQRRKLIATMRGYGEDFATLAAKGD